MSVDVYPHREWCWSERTYSNLSEHTATHDSLEEFLAISGQRKGFHKVVRTKSNTNFAFSFFEVQHWLAGYTNRNDYAV